ncbi:hypothetical protein TUM3811_21450 [Shewanella algae]|nr:hypothetical protein TUM3811_21450 [Shewanella algae]
MLFFAIQTLLAFQSTEAFAFGRYPYAPCQTAIMTTKPKQPNSSGIKSAPKGALVSKSEVKPKTKPTALP